MDDRIQKFSHIMRGGIEYAASDALCQKLVEMGFFEAPASTKWHGNYPGGLFDHSFEVTECLLHLTEDLDLEWGRPESPYYVGMLHDLCKCGVYRKKDDGSYEYAPDNTLPGHGERSVILIQTKLNLLLTEEEMLCIRWHMGAFDDKERWSGYTQAVAKYPSVLWTHTADMIASQIKGV